MAYQHVNSKGVTYHLNTKDVTLRGGKTVKIYYFSKDFREDTTTDLPDTKRVIENSKSGFLVVANAEVS